MYIVLCVVILAVSMLQAFFGAIAGSQSPSTEALITGSKLNTVMQT